MVRKLDRWRRIEYLQLSQPRLILDLEQNFRIRVGFQPR